MQLRSALGPDAGRFLVVSRERVALVGPEEVWTDVGEPTDGMRICVLRDGIKQRLTGDHIARPETSLLLAFILARRQNGISRVHPQQERVQLLPAHRLRTPPRLHHNL